MMGKAQTAILLVGLMRDLGKNWVAIKKLSLDNDIFVATSNSGLKEEDVAKLKEYCKSVVFVEDCDIFLTMQAQALGKRGGAVLLQWQKLDIAFGQMIDFEDFVGRRYKTVVKVRSDVNLSRINFDQFRMVQKNRLKSQTDVVFGGSRAAMLNFQGFFQIAQDHYYKNLSYQKIDWEVVAAWDPLAAGQHRILFPSSAVKKIFTLRALRVLFRFTTGPGHGVLHTHNLSRKLLSRAICEVAGNLNSFAEDGAGIPIGKDDGSPLFPSERSFATHAAKRGLVMLEMRPLISPYRLRHFRSRSLR